MINNYLFSISSIKLNKMKKLSQIAKQAKSKLKIVDICFLVRMTMARLLANIPAIPTVLSVTSSIHHWKVSKVSISSLDRLRQIDCDIFVDRKSNDDSRIVFFMRE